MFGNSRIEYTCTGYRRAQTYPITVCVTDPVPELCPGEYVRAYLRFGFSWFPPKREAAGGSTMSQSTTLKGANRMTGSAPRLDVGIWDLVATRFPVFPVSGRNRPRKIPELGTTLHTDALHPATPKCRVADRFPSYTSGNTSAAASIRFSGDCEPGIAEGATSPGCPSGRAAEWAIALHATTSGSGTRQPDFRFFRFLWIGKREKSRTSPNDVGATTTGAKPGA
ncbi:hypothetical protein EVAR_90486_1 [Eumeta japonica]|uniref:Uncharacterized protein n=1 Tax=Eumeta variegata TaxID=151549 RepID=A0A4C2AAZ7_EUMVA|nr:hypothetical protein EVAR_90486_1 [Eumeta japonica]